MHTDEECSEETAIVYRGVGRIKDVMPCPNGDGEEAGVGGEYAQRNKVDG